MKDFSASIIREKVSFAHQPLDGQEDKPAATQEEVVIRSNRIALKLEKDSGSEIVVVRAQTTAAALALAAKVMYSFHRTGLFLTRDAPYDWQGVWESVLSDYENTYNPNIWACIYIKGKPVFRTTTIAYMDIIEKIAVLHPDDYDAALESAEEAMQKLGHLVKINPELSVAGIFTNNRAEKSMRCGIIQRSKGRNVTFNFLLSGGESEFRIEQGLLAAGYLFEAINLKRIIQELQSRMRAGEVLQVSTEGRKLRHSAARMTFLKTLIAAIEEKFNVRYRPERPHIFTSDN